MARLRYNDLRNALGASHTNSVTTISLAGPLTHSNGTAVPTLSGGDYIPLCILDPVSGQLLEIVHLTAYTSSNSTGTITRGREGTTGIALPINAVVVCAPTAWDVTPLVFRGRIAPNTAITGGATIPWTEDTDTHAAHSGGSLTIPAGMGGLYMVALAWKPNAATAVTMTVHVNGTNVITTPGSVAAFVGMTATMILPLNAGDVLTVRASNTHTTTNDTTYNTWCHVLKVA